MTDAIAIQKQSGLVKSQTQNVLTAGTKAEIELIQGKIHTLYIGKKALSHADEMAFAVFCWLTDTNPATKESYWSPIIGPIIGVEKYMRSAKEQLFQESGKHDAIDFRTRQPEADELDEKFDATKGDIACVVTVTDPHSYKNWLSRVGATSDAIQKSLEKKDGTAWDKAVQTVGPSPKWEAIGIVWGSETFGNKATMYPRKRRCEKRARKAALRLRFPGMGIVDPEMGDSIEEITTIADEMLKELPAGPDWNPEVTQALIDGRCAQDDKMARWILSTNWNIGGEPNSDECLFYAKHFMAATDEGLSEGDAVEKARSKMEGYAMASMGYEGSKEAPEPPVEGFDWEFPPMEDIEEIKP